MQDQSCRHIFWDTRKAYNAYFFFVGFALALLGMAPMASATVAWRVHSVAPANDGTERVLWVAHYANGSSLGDIAAVWSVDANGTETAVGPSYGPYPGWTAQDIQVAPDGTTRLQWVKTGTYDSSNNYSGDTIAVWTLNSSGVKTAAGPAYGPFPEWTINSSHESFHVAHDSTVQLFWIKRDNTAGDSISVWRLNSVGSVIAQGPAYGSFPGWYSYGAQEASDDTVRVVWVSPGTTGTGGVFSGDQVSIWTLSTNGTETAIGPSYGPYTGWQNQGIEVAPDKTTRLNWVKLGNPTIGAPNPGDTVSIWTLDATGKATAQGPAYGPYPGWQSYFIQVAPDNTSRLFWVTYGTTDGSNNYSGDKVSLWSLNSIGVATAQGSAYGPYPGWTTRSFTVAPDGTSRLYWYKAGTSDVNGNYTGDTASIWTISSTGTAAAIGPAYGPYPNWSVHFLSPTTSSLTPLALEHNGRYGYEGDEFSIWSLNATNSATHIGPTYGPY